MQDRPNAQELLHALEEFMRERSDAAPDRYDRFQFLVAANTLAIIQRELALGDEFAVQEWIGLDSLLGRESIPRRLSERDERLIKRNAELCSRIDAGDFDGEREPLLLGHLYQTTINRVRIANPREAN